MNLQHATVVIAGASSGIGLAAAFAFAREGANLVLGARRGAELARAAALCAELGGRAVPFELDVGDPVQVQRLTDEAVRRFGRIDVWFNNAGVGVVGPFEVVPLETHDRVIRTNLLGVVHGSHAAVRQFMAQDRRGVLINMASLGGLFPAPFATSYTASKFAIGGFTDALRAELAARSEIAVCGVFPSFVDTPALGYAGNYTGRALDRLRPTLDPDEVAARIVDLARHPRRALFIGGPPLPRLAAALMPDLALRRAAAWAQAGLRHAPTAEPTTGNVMHPPAEAGRVHGGRRAGGTGGSGRAVAIAAAVVGAGVLLTALRRRAVA